MEGKAIIIKCSWCKKVLGDKPPYGASYDDAITDGICDECLNKYFPHHADAVRGSLEVKRVEEIYKKEE